MSLFLSLSRRLLDFLFLLGTCELVECGVRAASMDAMLDLALGWCGTLHTIFRRISLAFRVTLQKGFVFVCVSRLLMILISSIGMALVAIVAGNPSFLSRAQSNTRHISGACVFSKRHDITHSWVQLLIFIQIILPSGRRLSAGSRLHTVLSGCAS